MIYDYDYVQKFSSAPNSVFQAGSQNSDSVPGGTVHFSLIPSFSCFQLLLPFHTASDETGNEAHPMHCMCVWGGAKGVTFFSLEELLAYC